MTTIQAIDQVRMILDEVGIEYYSNDAVLQALEQAQIEKALEYRNAGRKDLISGMFRRATLTGNGANGITISFVPLSIEALLVRLRTTDPAPRAWARRVSPEEWAFYRFANGNAGNRSPYLQFTQYGGKIWHNGAGTEAELSYYVQPMLPTRDTQFLLREPHSAIVDLAAQILQGKEIIPRQVQEQMGAPERSGVGSFADIYKTQEQEKLNKKKDEQQ